jgi:hypothetical protein
VTLGTATLHTVQSELTRPDFRATRGLVLHVLAPFTLTRVLLAAVGLVAFALYPPVRDRTVYTTNPLLEIASHWDGEWYLRAAQQGYSFDPDAPSTAAFWPALPALMKLGALLTGSDSATAYLASGVIASNIALVVGLMYLVALLRLYFDEATAARAGRYLLVFPTTLYFSIVYPESLLLAFVAAGLYAARGGHWWLAGALAAGATLSRPYGIFILVPLLWEFWIRQPRPPIGRGLLMLLPPVVAFVSWIGFLSVISGDALVLLRLTRAWGRQLAAPWSPIVELFTNPAARLDDALPNIYFAVVYIVLVVAGWRLLPRSYSLYAAAVLLFVLCSSTTSSIPRYGLALFPIFATLSIAGRSPLFDRVYVAASFLSACCFMAAFALWFWIA